MKKMGKKAIVIFLTVIAFFLIYFLGLRCLFENYVENIYLQGLIMGVVSGLLVFIDLRIFRKLNAQQ